MAVEKITLDNKRQADIIAFFRVTDVYRSDTTRALDKLYGFSGTPRLTDHVHAYRLGYDTAAEELVIPVFIKLAGSIGHFCGIKMDEIPNDRQDYVKGTIHGGLLQTYEHEGVTVVEPAMKFAKGDVGIKRKVSPSTK